MIKKILKNEFNRNVLILMTGTSIAQAIPVAISPILARIYTPKDFGIFALYMSIATIIAVIATCKYELAIMLPKKDEDAINIVALSIAITFFVSFIFFLIVYIFNIRITNLLGNKELSNYLYFIPITVLLTGLYQSFYYWSNRKKQYKRLATSKVIQSGTRATTNLSLGFGGFGSGGLIIGGLVGQIISTGFLGRVIWKKDKSHFSKIKKNKIVDLANRYIKFPKFEILSGLFNTSSGQAPIILLTAFFNSTITGFYSFSYRLLSLPMSFFTSSISQVFLQESTKIKHQKNRLHDLTLSTFNKLFYTALLPMTFVGIYGDLIFSLIFGKNWITAGVYARILSLWLFFVFISSPLSTLLITLEKQKESFIFNFSIFASRLISLICGYYIFNDALKTIILYTFVGVVFWIFLMFYIFHIVEIKLIELSIPTVVLMTVIIVFYIIRISLFGKI